MSPAPHGLPGSIAAGTVGSGVVVGVVVGGVVVGVGGWLVVGGGAAPLHAATNETSEANDARRGMRGTYAISGVAPSRRASDR